MKAIVYFDVREEGTIHDYDIQPISYAISNLSSDEYNILKNHMKENFMVKNDFQNISFLEKEIQINNIELKTDNDELYYEIDFDNLILHNNDELKHIIIDSFENHTLICSNFGYKEIDDCDNVSIMMNVEVDKFNTKIVNG